MSGLTRLGWFNRLPEEQASEELLAVCHSRRWAERVAAGRPYADLAALERAADEAWMGLGPDDWREAFAAHPRIGEGGGRSPSWSAREQAGVGGAGEAVRAARDSAEILADLRARLGNDPDTELAVAAGQHRRITRLRLGKLLATQEDDR